MKAALNEWNPRLWSSMPSGLETVRIVQPMMTTAGPTVDADTALKNAAVWACVRYLSSTLAQLPWRVMMDNGDGTARRAPTHPVDWLIARRPNPEMGSFAWRETMVGWACRYGNAVSEIQRDNRGVPVALWPIHPTRVGFGRDDSGLVYGIRENDGSMRYLAASDVYHVRGFGEGSVGLDVISYAAESIGWARATELFGATFFGNGANASLIVRVPGKLSPEAKEEIDREMQRRHGGPGNSNRSMILDAKMEVEKTSVEPNDAQFIETRQHQVEEICRWFGVPPHKVMHLLRATFSNIEHQAIEVVQDSITPWCKRFEEEADYKLFGGNRLSFFTKLDLKGLLRGDFQSRQTGLQIMRRNGVINANEWRRLEDMDEIGPDGDKYIVEGNMTTLEAVGTLPDASQASAGSQQDSAGSQAPSSAVKRAREQQAKALLH
jgi:HK97 family phage portal protein